MFWHRPLSAAVGAFGYSVLNKPRPVFFSDIEDFTDSPKAKGVSWKNDPIVINALKDISQVTREPYEKVRSGFWNFFDRASYRNATDAATYCLCRVQENGSAPPSPDFYIFL